jgi:hypothetical protein
MLGARRACTPQAHARRCLRAHAQHAHHPIGFVKRARHRTRYAAQAIIEAANAPTTLEGDMVLRERGIPVLPGAGAQAGMQRARHAAQHEPRGQDTTLPPRMLRARCCRPHPAPASRGHARPAPAAVAAHTQTHARAPPRPRAQTATPTAAAWWCRSSSGCRTCRTSNGMRRRSAGA